MVRKHSLIPLLVHSKKYKYRKNYKSNQSSSPPTVHQVDHIIFMLQHCAYKESFGGKEGKEDFEFIDMTFYVYLYSLVIPFLGGKKCYKGKTDYGLKK